MKNDIISKFMIDIRSSFERVLDYIGNKFFKFDDSVSVFIKLAEEGLDKFALNRDLKACEHVGELIDRESSRVVSVKFLENTTENVFFLAVV